MTRRPDHIPPRKPFPKSVRAEVISRSGGACEKFGCGAVQGKTVDTATLSKKMDELQNPVHQGPQCTANNCRREVATTGYCYSHYKRFLKFGHAKENIPLRLAWGASEALILAAVSYQGDACLIWPGPDNGNGYSQSRFRGRKANAHQAICELTNGPAPASGMQAAHTCGRRECCNPTHIRWATPLQNSRDKVAHGTNIQGEQQWRSKLKESEVLEIRRRWEMGGVSQAAIAAAFGVAQSTIYEIVRRKTWRHI